jgi:diguanylate cyclase (GGDEF)-like protein
MREAAIMHYNLATRIVVALVGLTALALLGLYLSINSIRLALNDQARTMSVESVASRMDTLHEKLRMMARDYNNWADVYLALQNSDLDFVADNYAITALFGDMFNAVTMFGGPLPQPIAWTEGGDRQPVSTFLTSVEMTEIRSKVKYLDVSRRETLDFYMMIGNQLNFVSASYVLPDTDMLLRSVKIEDLAIAVLARKLQEREIREMQKALKVSDAHVSDHAKAREECLPLAGVFITAAAHLCWLPHQTGDALVATLRPVLFGIVAAVLLVASVGIAAVNRHAQDLVRREREAGVLARVDTLTGLPNRLAFNEYLSQAVSKTPEGFALIVIDLNGFKRINDMVGHQSGDDVLRLVGRSIADCSGEEAFVARLGGDEFGVCIWDEVSIKRRINEMSQRLMMEIHKPIVVQGHSFEISAAQGAAICGTLDLSAEELLRRADYAMYFAKHRKSGRISLYSEAMERTSQLDRQIEKGLRSGLERPAEFHIQYQPIVEASDGSFVRAEALARWSPPRLGQISPDTFIRVAEDSALIIPLGWILLDQVCRDIRPFPELCVNVNISPLQLLDEGFVEEFLCVLASHKISPLRIEIEVTESAAILNHEVIKIRLRQLRQEGVRVALDDFGSGYSSFGSLRMLSLDTLKIDKSLVTHASITNGSRALVQSVVTLGQSMGTRIVGEGVETESDAQFLRRAGCSLLQGFLFGRPMSIEDLVARFAFPELIAV